MSPARVFDTMGHDHQLRVLATALDTLLVSFYELSIKEQTLEKRVNYAYDQYLKLAQHIPGGPSAESTVISKQILDPEPEHNSLAASKPDPFDIVDHLRDSGHLRGEAFDALSAGVECCKNLSHLAGNDQNAHLSTHSPHEHDFTTHRTQGSLGCPFSKLQDPTNSSKEVPNIETFPIKKECQVDSGDPIKAELLQERLSSTGFSAGSSSAPRCPIRYLDQHSPEQIAQYLEVHKHEIPRSHAICVKRYQNNAERMRQIDAKYGNLANMIQGLSEKHKPILEHQEPTHNETGSSTSAERVGKWAEDVRSRSPALEAVPKAEPEEGEDRSGRFERPLREIRVGESPSRPWGIALPEQLAPNPLDSPAAPVRVPAGLDATRAKDTPTLGSPLAASSQEAALASSRPAGKCPFNHGTKKSTHVNSTTDRVEGAQQSLTERLLKEQDATKNDHIAESSRPEQSVKRPSSPARMVFNGPVFFGYTAESAALMLQQLENGRGSV